MNPRTYLKYLLQDATGTETSDAVAIGQLAMRGNDEFVVQFNIAGGTATVVLEGRLAPNLPWAAIESVSEPSIKVYARIPEIRARIASNAGATVNVLVAH